ncbi:DUF5316 family protein [Gracilibacillus salinarum]|uniref:DUF5316 domain-containing protein n=1 Tax=Gracilibacillus salinarum TaxID=2932255 RepID=A0ABY4GT14_9BACI|nr:DUF5316 family protein [Gracilibacillus salinarum]UOQ87285.1 DUF5316 domain-containing protein [Gracilibacillus salinarum]
MTKFSWWIGISVAVISVTIGLFSRNLELVLTISGIAFIVPILLAVIFSGALVSGDRMHSIFLTESKEKRTEKNRWIKNLLAIALPNLFVILIIVGITYVTG